MYAAGFCRELASEYARRDHAVAPEIPRILIDKHGTYDQYAAESKRQARERESKAAPGGLRNPRSSVSSVPTWQAVWGRVRFRIETVLRRRFEETRKVFDIIGGDDANGIPESIILETKWNLELRFGIEHGRAGNACWQKILRGDILRSIADASKDPDAPAAKCVDEHTLLGVELHTLCHGIFLSYSHSDPDKSYRIEDAETQCESDELFDNH